MARGINKVILIGNLGIDPEVRYMTNGKPVANFSVATTEGWVDKDSGERQERTEWHRVVLFNRLGEIAGEYLRKGMKVYIEGKLRTRKWVDKNEQERYTTEIHANEMQMLDSKGSAGAGMNELPPQQSNMSTQAPLQGTTKTATKPTAEPVAEGEFDDDIPF